jgi:hypothetical protein
MNSKYVMNKFLFSQVGARTSWTSESHGRHHAEKETKIKFGPAMIGLNRKIQKKETLRRDLTEFRRQIALTHHDTRWYSDRLKACNFCEHIQNPLGWQI